MKRTRSKKTLVSLALFWLVATSLWAPVTVLAHASSMHSGYEQVLNQYAQKASSDSCHMDDCAGSVDKMTDCQFACQFYIESSAFHVDMVYTVDTYSIPTGSYIKYPSLALLERPPRHSR